MSIIAIFIMIKNWRNFFLNRFIFCRPMLFLFAGLLLISSNALAIDKPITTDSRMKVFVHNPYEVYPLLFHHKYMSYIDFPEDEKVKSVSLGESTGWRVEVDNSRIYIQPIEGDVRTNMIITTGKKRNYVFDIYAHAGTEMSNDEDITYSVRFFYPMEEEKKELKELIDQITDANDSNMPQQQKMNNVNGMVGKKDMKAIEKNMQQVPTMKPEIKTIEHVLDEVKKYAKININYTYSGTAKVSPREIFDDGRMVYITMQNANELPANIGYLGKDDKVHSLKSIVNGNVLIVNQVLDKMVLYYSQDEYLIIHKN